MRLTMLTAVLLIGAMTIACEDPTMQPPELPAGAVQAGTKLGEAAITGRVTFSGDMPEPEAINMGSDAACARKHEGEVTREDMMVGPGGGLGNVVVYIGTGLDETAFEPSGEEVRLDQRGCVYKPHVVAVQVGQPLTIVNSDPTLHNVHAVAKSNREFNFGMAVEGQKSTRYFHQPEVFVRLKCDVHPWMSAYVAVLANPYFAVTGPDGSFTLGGLPAGDYLVVAHHEKLGESRKQVTLAEQERVEIEFEFQ